MVFIGVLLGVAVLAGLAIWAFRRRGSDEAHSIAGYQNRLARLEEVRRRQLGGSVQILGGSNEVEERAGQPVIGESGRIEISSSNAPRRFEDTGRLPVHTERRPPPPPYRRREVSMARISRRPRRLGAPIAAAVVVIILVTGLAIAGARSRTPHSTTTTTAVHHRGSGTGSTSTSTTTTTARPTTFTAASTSGLDATYQLPFASYTVEFTATTGDCYVEVVNAQGQVPYAAVLDAGQSKQLTLNGNSKVDLGAPSFVQVKVDRTPVVFPSPLPAPLNLIFDAAASTTTTTTTTTTATTAP